MAAKSSIAGAVVVADAAVGAGHMEMEQPAEQASEDIAVVVALHNTSAAAAAGSAVAFVMSVHRTCRDVGHGQRAKLPMRENSTEEYGS